ncbi:MAG TPA: LysM peptidoglycan-binding domain-containing protein [Mycobacteriales bacterium]|nr:LysM peptidoglycan-binding domain-containing protein [Mycobacteriales bacterium]
MVAVAVVLHTAAFCWLGLQLAHVRTAVPPTAPTVVEVRPGDTLWSIARRVAPDADARAVVDSLRRGNGLPDGTVHPGQILYVRP